MSDSTAEAVGSPIERFGSTWARLTMSDYGVLETKYRTNVKAAAKASLEGEADNLSPARRAESLVDVAARPATIDQVDLWLLTHAGATEALRLSLKRAGVTTADQQTAAIERIPAMGYASQLARVVVGFIRDQTPEENVDRLRKELADAEKRLPAKEESDPS